MVRQNFESLRRNQGPHGLGGWLLLIVVAILLVSMLQFYFAISFYPTMLSWIPQGSGPFAAGTIIRILSDIALIGMAGAALWLGRNRATVFPDLCVMWSGLLFITSLAADTCFAFDEVIIPHTTYPSFMATKIAALLVAMIVPYMFTSVRVRNTFFAGIGGRRAYP
ncbi:MAG: DUF2569 family protein [Methylobacteriaceae bacterium]|jgi:hypothetical protein|nr:DUF2569 family protein [Methylobacteriaceae bacterium]